LDKKTINRFVESWGEMGTLWGLNSSMARIHALLIVSEKPHSLDTIAKRLKISRGNASMCLKELRSWGVIKRTKIAGDRRDYYVTEPDIWKMFFSIAKERKRREFDPTLETVRETLEAARQNHEGGIEERLKQMEELLTVMDKVAERFLNDERASRGLLEFLAGSPFTKKR
jgi:DNA-binding transcriptional regulator GbsR (MarR family)